MARNLNFCFTKFKSLSSPEHSLPDSDTHPSLLIKNFNSLYENFNAAPPEHHSSSSSSPDIATIFASRRFFFSSPGQSNSIIDSSSSSSSLASTSNSSSSTFTHTVSGGGSIAVPTYSPDPFADFRQSMQEMVEARAIHDVRQNWDYLHELLMCYLSLNPKSTHKFIVGAFADLLVTLMTTHSHTAGKRKISPQYL